MGRDDFLPVSPPFPLCQPPLPHNQQSYNPKLVWTWEGEPQKKRANISGLMQVCTKMTAKQSQKDMIQDFWLRVFQGISAALIYFCSFWKPWMVEEPETEHGGKEHALKMGLEALSYMPTFSLKANVGLKQDCALCKRHLGHFPASPTTWTFYHPSYRSIEA